MKACWWAVAWGLVGYLSFRKLWKSHSRHLIFSFYLLCVDVVTLASSCINKRSLIRVWGILHWLCFFVLLYSLRDSSEPSSCKSFSRNHHQRHHIMAWPRAADARNISRLPNILQRYQTWAWFQRHLERKCFVFRDSASATFYRIQNQCEVFDFGRRREDESIHLYMDSTIR